MSWRDGDGTKVKELLVRDREREGGRQKQRQTGRQRDRARETEREGGRMNGEGESGNFTDLLEKG